MAGVALGSTGHIAAVTVADDRGAATWPGPRLWSGAPGAAVVLGAALGATLLVAADGPPRPADRARPLGYAVGVVGRDRGDGGRHRSIRCRCCWSGRCLIGFGNSVEPALPVRGRGPLSRSPAARRPSASWSGARRSAPSLGPNLVGWAGGLGERVRAAAARRRRTSCRSSSSARPRSCRSCSCARTRTRWPTGAHRTDLTAPRPVADPAASGSCGARTSRRRSSRWLPDRSSWS